MPHDDGTTRSNVVQRAPPAVSRGAAPFAAPLPTDDRAAQPVGIRGLQPIRVADRILFRGLLFSPYDTVHLILETDYPAIPQSQRQTVALKLTRICSPIFERTPLGDDFAQRPEFRLLKERLRRAIRRWIDENGVPGYQSPERPAPLAKHFK